MKEKRVSTYESIRLDRDGAIATITIDNQRRANALSVQIIDEMARAVAEVAADEALRAAIITGAGRNFIGGADIGELKQLTAVTARGFIRHLHATIETIRKTEKPIIAAVNGACLGAGLELAIGCDIVVASEAAVFGMPEIEVGIPSVIEAALLVNLIGALRTKEFLLTGDRWDAATAERHGMVNHVVPAGALLDRARAIGNRIAEHSPTAVALQKDLVSRWMTTDLDTAIEYGVNALGIAFTTGDPQEAMAAFQEKRPPRFAWRK